MTPQLARAHVLIDQNRYEQALGELQLHLGQHAEDYEALALQALCLLRLERYDEAQQQAQAAIHLAPDQPIGYRMLAGVLTERNRFREAEQAIDTALQMDPEDPDLYGLKAMILTQLRRWKEVVAAADTGLMHDPENVVCLNARAQALTMLGNRAGAAATIEDALRKNPEDPWIHANQGWACLHANQPTKAAEHFREALRLDPEMDFARAGIIEALKARNFLYRWMLQYFLFMARLPAQYRWGIILGLYFLQMFLSNLAARNPAVAPYALPVLGVYIVFAVMTWLSSPLANLLLRLDRFGKHALSADQRRGATLLGLNLLVALAFLITSFVISTPVLATMFLNGALVFGLVSLPLSAIYSCESGWPRQAMAAGTAALALIGLCWMLPQGLTVRWQGQDVLQLPRSLAAFFPMGVIASQFLAMNLVTARVRK
jgi:tetratricopeptide (TPR) repeat protein